MQQVILKISGRVQGVFFRAHAQKKAIALDLYGWIKNDVDGGVSILVQGEAAALQNFIDWCKKGPPESAVEAVKTQFDPHPKEIFDSFQIIG